MTSVASSPLQRTSVPRTQSQARCRTLAGTRSPCEARLRKSLLAYLAQASGQLEAFQLTAAEERALADTPQARRQLDFA